MPMVASRAAVKLAIVRPVTKWARRIDHLDRSGM
jgi:hypothetical protein